MPKRAYIALTPELVVTLFKSPITAGGLKFTSDMPQDAQAVRAWVGNGGDVCVSFDSGSNRPIEDGEMLPVFTPTVTKDS